MKLIFYSFLMMVMIIPSILISQTIKGKLVDADSTELSGLQLKLYINPNIYRTTSASNGTFTFNNVIELKLPTEYSVSNNFPNPFNPKTRIFITLQNNGNVKVIVFNLLGQKVLADIDRNFSAGTSYIDLDLKGSSNGIYLARISINNQYTVVKKMMLLHGSQHMNTSVVEPNMSDNQMRILQKTNSTVSIDSLVVTGDSISKNRYTNLPKYTGSNLNLGNIVVDRTRIVSCPGIPTITYAGQIYHTVQIGSQCWLRENLNVGTMIFGNVDQTNNGVVEKYCYNDSTTNCDKYGGLYQWAEAVQYTNGATNSTMASPALTGNVQGICPDGWHIPTQTEFQTLAKAVNDGTGVYQNANALKIFGEGNYGGVGTNTSGFSALFAGNHYYNSAFDHLGYNTYFWSSSEDDTNFVYRMDLSWASNFIYIMDYYKNSANSIRCLKN